MHFTYTCSPHFTSLPRNDACMDEPVSRSLQLAFSWIAIALRSVGAATAAPVSFRVLEQYGSVSKDVRKIYLPALSTFEGWQREVAFWVIHWMPS